jgi:hypothetical protein
MDRAIVQVQKEASFSDRSFNKMAIQCNPLFSRSRAECDRYARKTPLLSRMVGLCYKTTGV